ncbi:MAG: SMP-30/gluconolactonase/LRE family protein [Deltaproteobacteria bacterium]|nr:SMP-30/gluconolactonase/LRE family protein [Deltaproteobacteria bacterium]MBW2363024.1 SMP-30/gluconolactonase/LRE family protein [Deltaproteobacteria bacterium]
MQDQRLELHSEGLRFGEGPRWHEDALVLSDMADGRVVRIAEPNKPETLVEFDGRPSGLGWLPDGRLLVVSMLDHRLLRLDPGGLTPVADLSELCGGHANDMVVDAKGRAYISNIGFELEGIPYDQLEIRATNLIRVDPDGSVHRAASDLMCPNGMAISADGRRLIVGESGAMALTVFDVAEDGSLSGRRSFAQLEGGATVDGMCLDAEGCVWAASPSTQEFLRVREGGEIADRVSLGDRAAIACVLGGAERRTLFCITNGYTSIVDAAKDRSGRVETLRVDVPGAGRP